MRMRRGVYTLARRRWDLATPRRSLASARARGAARKGMLAGMNLTDHRATLLHQFTLQATPFGELGAHAAEEALGLFVELGHLAPSHRVLDAGCGPGLLACHLAPHVAQVTGVDVTTAMLDAARARAARGAHENVTLLEADMLSLPFPDGAFDRVCTRFTFHHVPDAAAAFRELVRVTKPGGR